jgi:hypothetical protein
VFVPVVSSVLSRASQSKVFPEPEQSEQAEQRSWSASQLKEVPEPEQISQLPVQREALAAQLPPEQTSQFPVQSALILVQVPKEPATLHLSQFPPQVELQQ